MISAGVKRSILKKKLVRISPLRQTNGPSKDFPKKNFNPYANTDRFSLKILCEVIWLLVMPATGNLCNTWSHVMIKLPKLPIYRIIIQHGALERCFELFVRSILQILIFRLINSSRGGISGRCRIIRIPASFQLLENVFGTWN